MNPQIHESKETADASPQTILDNTDSAWALLIPAKGYWVTPVLLWMNLILFICMALSDQSFFDLSVESLENWGGTVDRLTFDQQPWRLVSAFFLHGGILHLAMNMYSLLFVGAILESLLGSWRYLAAYFSAGLVASITSTWWNSNTVGVGASGAIFGLNAIFITLLLLRKDIFGQSSSSLLVNLAIFVGYNLIYGLTKGGIDNAAHVGGLLFGIACGFTCGYFLEDKHRNHLPGSALMLGASLAICLPVWFHYHAATQNWNRFVEAYHARWVQIDSASSGLDTQLNSDSLLNRIENTIIPLWKENQSLTKTMESPPKKEDAYLLDRYAFISETMIERWNLAAQFVRTEDTLLLNQMKEKDARVDSLLSN